MVAAPVGNHDILLEKWSNNNWDIGEMEISFHKSCIFSFNENTLKLDDADDDDDDDYGYETGLDYLSIMMNSHTKRSINLFKSIKMINFQ